jgi:hypothetical protein
MIGDVYRTLLLCALVVLTMALAVVEATGESNPLPASPTRAVEPGATATGRAVASALGLELPTPGPTVVTIAPAFGVAATPMPTRRTKMRGLATWYPAQIGHAAAGPSLRVGRWRGRIVVVCVGATRRCISVRLTDWCRCGHGHIVDLAAGSFRRLAPLSRGVVSVVVSWRLSTK